MPNIHIELKFFATIDYLVVIMVIEKYFVVSFRFVSNVNRTFDKTRKTEEKEIENTEDAKVTEGLQKCELSKKFASFYLNFSSLHVEI